MLSPLSYLLLRQRRAAAGECSGSGWLSGATAPSLVTPKRNPFLFFIFYVFSSSFPSLYSILNPKSPNTNPKLLDLKKTKGKKERKENYLCEFGLSCRAWDRLCGLRSWCWCGFELMFAMNTFFTYQIIQKKHHNRIPNQQRATNNTTNLAINPNLTIIITSASLNPPTKK